MCYHLFYGNKTVVIKLILHCNVLTVLFHFKHFLSFDLHEVSFGVI